MVLESKRRIERLAMVTLPDRMFHFLKWTALMLVLFILVHIVWQMSHKEGNGTGHRHQPHQEAAHAGWKTRVIHPVRMMRVHTYSSS